MQYFQDLVSESDIKARYRSLAKEFHPDKGGDISFMKEVNNQYEKVLRGFYQKSGMSMTEEDRAFELDKILAEKIQAVSFEDVDIELCGKWLWVSGNTKQYKDILKSHGFKWASNKGMWYFHKAEDTRKHWGKKFSIDEIRTMHGTQSFKNQKVKIG